MKFCWVTINVKDLEESLSFYTDIVGLTVNRRMTPMPGTEIAFLGSGETEVELIRNEQNANPSHGRDVSLGFEVASLDERIRMLKEKGVSEIQGPFQPGPRAKFIYITDPNGVSIQFVQNVAP